MSVFVTGHGDGEAAGEDPGEVDQHDPPPQLEQSHEEQSYE